ncbi:MAG: amino acid ABC transporter substrate-binding protein [Geminicoccaceae bacterium]
MSIRRELAVTRLIGVFLVLLLTMTAVEAQSKNARERTPFIFTYLARADDPRYETRRAYTGLTLRERKRPIDGAEAGLRESKVLGRRAGLSFELNEILLGEGETAKDTIDEAMAGGQGIFLLDLPLEEMKAAAEAAHNEEALLFDVRHPDTELRQGFCPDNLFYMLPSLAMTADALAQYLREKGWQSILMLTGPEEADAKDAAAFKNAAEKFGLDIVAERDFILSNDPRNRDRNNIALMTGEPDHDVVYLADNLGEFGRYVPFATYLARPVVGSEGLIASGWHWTWERHGAPQLNQRFAKKAGRNMVAEDWAAWAAVKSVVEAVTRTESTRAKDLHAFLTSDDFTLDTYKGAPGSFRPWNRQLRQPILLHAHNAVIERAPLPEFLHATNQLDTLGLDRPDSDCR